MADKGLECEVRAENARVECTTTGTHVVEMSFAERGARIPAPLEPARPGPLGRPVASPRDLVSSKLHCIEQCADARDYIDLAEAELRWPGIIRRAAGRLHGNTPGQDETRASAVPPPNIAAMLSSKQLRALEQASGRWNRSKNTGKES